MRERTVGTIDAFWDAIWDATRDFMQDAAQIANDLDEMASLLEFSNSSRFKVKAYCKAARIVAALGDEFGALVEQGRLRKFGIGAALSQQIEEIWNTGASEPLTRLRSQVPFLLSVDAHSTRGMGCDRCVRFASSARAALTWPQVG